MGAKFRNAIAGAIVVKTFRNKKHGNGVENAGVGEICVARARGQEGEVELTHHVLLLLCRFLEI